MLFKKNISEYTDNEWFHQVYREYHLAAQRGIRSALLYFEVHGTNILFSPTIEQDVFRKEFLLGQLFDAYKTVLKEKLYDNRLLNSIYITKPDQNQKYSDKLVVLFSNEGYTQIKAKLDLYLKHEQLKIERAELEETKLIEDHLLKLKEFFVQHTIDYRLAYLENSLAEKRTASRSLNKLYKVLQELKLNENEFQLLPGFNLILTVNNDGQAKLKYENNVLFIKPTVSKEDLHKVLRHLLDKRQTTSQKPAEPDIVEYIATTALLDIDADYFIKLVPSNPKLIKKFIKFYHPDKWHQHLHVAEKKKLTELTQKLTEKLASCEASK